MRYARTLLVLLILHATFCVSRGDISNQQLQEWVDASILTFTGTIVKMGKSNVSSINSQDDTMIVTVNKVQSSNQEALKKFGSLEGKELTVVANSTLRAGLAKNVSAVFFVDPWVYETNIAVKAKAVANENSVPDLLKRLSVAGLRKAEAPLRSAIASAKLIVTGVVQEVRPLAGAKAKYLGSVDNGWQVCSEHRPRWKEAVVRVTSVEKGSSGDLVIIIFPSVRDCFWNESPKFIVGQIGTWLLHKDQLGEAGAAVLLKSEKLLDREIQSYTALAPADFQPTDPDGKTAKRITELIKTKTP